MGSPAEQGGGGVRFGIPLDGADNAFLWNDGYWFLTDLFWRIEMGKSIRSHILGTWTIGDGKVKASEKQHPPGLSVIKSLIIT